jgi:phosphoglycerate dehydrogenase-like enzyme
MRSLEFIQISSAGYSQLFNLGLVEKGIRASNAQGVFDVPIAEWCVSMMINLARDLRGMIRNQEARIWERPARFQREIRGSTVGIWGYGSIGREIARQAKSMGMKVVAMDRLVKKRSTLPDIYSVEGTGDPEALIPDNVFLPGQEEDFLKDLDYLILAMPLTNNTKGMIGEKELKCLPKTAYVLNPARGPIIVEEALLKALREGWIAGAALDTHYHYPMPADHPLWCFPNVIFTPHISGSSLSPHYTERIWDIFVQNVERILAGRPLLNELSTKKLNGE